MVAGLTLMIAFTFGALVWLASDVDRSVSNQSAAQSIAFQAARSGAQAAQVDSLRSGDTETLDPAAARTAATTLANALFSSYGVSGTVSVAVDAGSAKVTVTVSITDAGRTVTGVGAARAERASELPI